MSYLFTILSVLFLILVGGSVAYLVTVLIAAAIAKRRSGRDRACAAAGLADDCAPKIAVLIPAHNERLVIGSTLDSLLAQTYARDQFEVVVVADNCTDDTAQIARARGVTVLERTNPDLRGKGHALNWAVDQLLEREPGGAGPIDAFVIIDADTQAAPDFLEVIARRFAASVDSRGYCALQGRYGVLNASEGWRAGLMAGAFELFNHVRPLGRHSLGLTVGLKGNGMAFSRQLMCDARWSGSVTEDIDYALDLCRHHNLRVEYVPAARVDAQMPTTGEAAASQRSRWESGRFGLMRRLALPMLAEGLRRRSVLMIEATVDLAIPPLAELAAMMVAWAVIVGIGTVTGQLPHAIAWMNAVAVSSIALFAYILGGFAVAGASRDAYSALVFAPFYAAWKLCLYASRTHRKRASGGEWIRTERAPVEVKPVVAIPALKGSEAE